MLAVAELEAAAEMRLQEAGRSARFDGREQKSCSVTKQEDPARRICYRGVVGSVIIFERHV